MTFASSLEALVAWRDTRLPLRRFLALALLVAWAASIGRDPVGALRAIAVVLVATALIAQFRLWDDLVDRLRDRELYPGRVLASESLAQEPFVVALWVLAGVNAVAIYILGDALRCCGFLLLVAALGSWYRCYPRRDLPHALVLYLKYPLFVWLLSGYALGTTTLAAAVLIYASLIGFELIDSPELRVGAGEGVLAVALAVLAAAPMVLARGMAGIVATAFNVLVIGCAWISRRDSASRLWLRYLPIAAAAASLIAASSGETT